MLFANSIFALPINNHPELFVVGRIQNEGYLNWGAWGRQLHFTAYNSTALPSNFFAYQQRNGEFRISTQANTQQIFNLSYQANPSVEATGPFYNIDQALCRFTLQVNAQGLARLSVNTLDNSYVQCRVSQDAEGKWIITLTNPPGIN